MQSRKIDLLLDEYGESHRNKTNKLIHWVCVPIIFFSIIGLLWSIPAGYFETLIPGKYSELLNWGTIGLTLALIYYLFLSIPLFLGMLIIAAVFVFGNYFLSQNAELPLWAICLILFIVAWIGQFYGHKVEGKKPSFFKDVQFLLIGPAWLLSFIFKKLGIRY